MVRAPKRLWQAQRLSVLFAAALCSLALWHIQISAASCVPPSTDYGSITNLSSAITSSGTYRIWSRLAAPDVTHNNYMLEVDGNACYTIGGGTVPVYANGATTFFANDSSNWISKTTSGTQMDISLSAGTHTFKLIGTSSGVVVDRLVMTQDTTCIPTGTGDNCANPPDTTPPVVNITAPANNASGGNPVSVAVNATDDVAVSKVELYIDGVLAGTAAGQPYTFSVSPAVGQHTLTAKAYDAAGNNAISAAVSYTVAGTGAIYLAADINRDGHVNYLDLSALASMYGKTGSAITIQRADINGDGVVNYLDLSALANKYGQ